MSRLVGSVFSKVLPNNRSDPWADEKLFTRHEYFARHRKPTITITSPTIGAAGSRFPADTFPTLTWTAPTDTSFPIIEYLLVVEDLDVPVSGPHWAAAFYAIPASTTTITQSDLTKVKSGTFERRLTGGFKYAPVGKGNGKVWYPPHPMRGSGPHRFFFQLIALKDTVDKSDLSQFPTKSSFYGFIEGKVVGWGEWMGLVERN